MTLQQFDLGNALVPANPFAQDRVCRRRSEKAESESEHILHGCAFKAKNTLDDEFERGLESVPILISNTSGG